MESGARLSGILRGFSGKRILVAGDLILDRYWWGNASRLSPEAPVPVVRRESSSARPGGAANTAANLMSLGATAELFGVTGADREAEEFRAALSSVGVRDAHIFTEPGRPTTTKTRVMALNQQVVRVDHEATAPIGEGVADEAAARITERLPGAAGLVFSDYAKGFLTPALLAACIAAAKTAGVPVFVDPKGPDATRYAGCSLLKPNRHELGILAGVEIHSHDDTVAAGNKLSAAMPGTKILVTEGAGGMTMFAAGELLDRVAAAPRQVYDVTGAGDTVLAVMALAESVGASDREAMELAAAAASIAVGVMGTATVSVEQLEACFHSRRAERPV